VASLEGQPCVQLWPCQCRVDSCSGGGISSWEDGGVLDSNGRAGAAMVGGGAGRCRDEHVTPDRRHFQRWLRACVRMNAPRAADAV
jgi:hypothetical protein